MKHYIIHGRCELKGRVKVSGSKNASLPIMAASILTDEDVILSNVPRLRDTKTMVSLLELLGKKVQIEADRMIIRKDTRSRQNASDSYKATYAIVKQMRASIVVLGPLLARYHKACVSFPGGCSFGPRPIDLHMKGMEALGVGITLEGGYINASVKKEHGLRGCRIRLSGPNGSTVLGTDNVAMAACLAKGTTIIEDAAQEPETQDLLYFLEHMGVRIHGVGTSTVTLHGGGVLHGGEYRVIDDRIEAGTFLIYAALTGTRDFFIETHQPYHLESAVELLKQIGVHITQEPNGFHVKAKSPLSYQPFHMITRAYPGFPTDLQSILMVLGSRIQGESTIKESIYPNRFNHVDELQRMGANIRMENALARMIGVRTLKGADVQASDLRSGAALIGAGLVAKGQTVIRRVYHIERGYENLVEKIKGFRH